MVYGQGGLSELRRGGRSFGGLGLQGHPDGFYLRNLFEGSFTEEGTGAGKAVFEGVFTFEASEASNNFDSTDSAVLREEDWSKSPSTQKHRKLEGKLKHWVKLSIILPGSKQVVIGKQIRGTDIEKQIWKRAALSKRLLEIYEKY